MEKLSFNEQIEQRSRTTGILMLCLTIKEKPFNIKI